MKSRDTIKKTIDLYQNEGWKKFFSRWRFWVAPYVQVEKYIPKSGNIVEIGCGEGIFTNYAALSSQKRKLTGIDIDKKRLHQANKNLKNTKFIEGDGMKITIPKSNAVVMFHLLHHLTSKNDQEKLIINSLKSLKKKGKLIIVEIDNKPLVKYLIAWIFDHLFVAWVFEKKLFEPLIFFRKKDEWIKLLKKNKANMVVRRAHKNKPFSHIVFIVTKK